MESKKDNNTQVEIKDALTCFICASKVSEPLMCQKCKKLVCTKCIKKWYENHDKCPYCQVQSSFDKMISLPFMDEISQFFMNAIDNNNQKLRRIKVNRNPNLNEVQRQIALQYKYQIPKNEVIPKENKNKDEIKDDNGKVGKNKVQNYYEHFTSNLNIIYENQFILEKNEKLIESPLRGAILKISNFELSLNFHYF